MNRLIALTRDVPHSYPVTLTAGELLVLLATIAAPPPSTIRNPQSNEATREESASPGRP